MDHNDTMSKPKTIKRIALYVIYDCDGVLDGFRKYYLQKLRPTVDYIVAVVSGNITDTSRKELSLLVDDVYQRNNVGLLAGSWVDGIKHIGWDTLYRYDELLMLNDSFFGPFYPLSEIFEKEDKSDADFYGVIKNFEEKTFSQIAGRPLKHGMFRGSICYFYIIRSKLLHSIDFKKYWGFMPDIKKNWDTYFFAEIDFYDYVIDSGFKVDAFQTDELKGYCFDNLTQNMTKLIRDEHIPFARIRPFCTDIRDQSIQVSYCDDPRKALEYIKNNTEYDTNLIWDYILRTKNLTDIFNQLQLQYVVPKDCVEKPFKYKKRIAVILHIFYDDLIEKILKYCLNFPHNTMFFITTVDEKTKVNVEKMFGKTSIKFTCIIRPNVGVAMSSLWITYADVVLSGEYEYICYFHDKKSPYGNYRMQGDQFADRCYDNLFGSKEVVKNIINIFEDNPRLGIIGPPMVYHGDYFTIPQRSWPGNYQNTIKLSETLGLHVNINPEITPVAPYGDMFWFRSKSLKKAIGHKFTYDDFNIKYEIDFTLFHAIERIYGFAAQDSGYYYAEVVNSDCARSDLINYQYMLYSICDMMWKGGLDIRNHESAKVALYTVMYNAKNNTKQPQVVNNPPVTPQYIQTCDYSLYAILCNLKNEFSKKCNPQIATVLSKIYCKSGIKKTINKVWWKLNH